MSAEPALQAVDPGQEQSGVWSEFADLGDNAIVSEEGLASIFGKHRDSIKRAVERGELPKPFKLMGKPVWRIAGILDHFKALEEDAQKEPKQKVKDFHAHRP